MKFLIAAACLSVIVLTAYVIGGDYVSSGFSSDADLRRKCDEIIATGGNVDPSSMTEEQKRAALELARKCMDRLKG